MTDTLDIGSHLMVAIFQELPLVCFIGKPDAVEYQRLCRPEIERLGRVFKFLGLAEASTNSAIGWKPTADLLHLIGKRLAGHPIKGSRKLATAKERKVIESLIQVAGGQAEHVITDIFAFGVLEALGLLRMDKVGDWKPTSLLQERLKTSLEHRASTTCHRGGGSHTHSESAAFL